MRKHSRPGFITSFSQWTRENKFLSFVVIVGTVFTVPGLYRFLFPTLYDVKEVMRNHPDYEPPTDE